MQKCYKTSENYTELIEGVNWELLKVEILRPEWTVDTYANFLTFKKW